MERENQEYISIVNATENNLKHVSLKIPKKKITVFTGVSGSGKSSLCLDTIAAESRRELNLLIVVMKCVGLNLLVLLMALIVRLKI